MTNITHTGGIWIETYHSYHPRTPLKTGGELRSSGMVSKGEKKFKKIKLSVEAECYIVSKAVPYLLNFLTVYQLSNRHSYKIFNNYFLRSIYIPSD
jgi:hypothetical protein